MSLVDYFESVSISYTYIDNVLYQRHGMALIPAQSLPAYHSPSEPEIQLALRKTGALLALITRETSVSETQWWAVVCREFQSIETLKKKTRWAIRQGLKNYRYELSNANQLVEYGYGVHVASFQRYVDANPMPEEDYIQMVEAMQASSQFEFMVVYSEADSDIAGYAILQVDDTGVFIHTMDIPELHLKNNAAYGLVYSIVEHYLANLGKTIGNGTRSLIHETKMQDFLVKFGFGREYSILHVSTTYWLALVLKVTSPFLNILQESPLLPRKLKGLNLLYTISKSNNKDPQGN